MRGCGFMRTTRCDRAVRSNESKPMNSLLWSLIMSYRLMTVVGGMADQAGFSRWSIHREA